MEIQSAFNAGVQGFQNATAKANNAAADIAASTTYDAENTAEELAAGQEGTSNTTDQTSQSKETPNLNQSIVDLKVAEFQAKASANVIQTADDNLGTLLDVTV